MANQPSGRMSIIPARAYDDVLMTPSLRDVLGVIGTYGDKEGYCFPKQDTMAKRLGVSRQYLNRQALKLEELGYIQIVRRTREDGGQMGHAYRILYDPMLPKERQRDTDTPATSEVAPPATSEVAPITSHRNDTHKRPTLMPSASPQNGQQAEPIPLFPSEEKHPTTTAQPAQQQIASAAKSSAPRPRNLLWDALERASGHPPTPAQRRAWGRAIQDLKEMDATPEQVLERAAIYRSRWPSMTFTANALAKHWHDLAPQANISALPPQRVASFADPPRRRMQNFEEVYG